MASTEDAAVLAEARLTSLQLPPLLHACLPEIVTNVAEMCGPEAEIVCLPLATITALPAQELGAMLWTLQLPLGGTAAADQFHCESSLHILVQIVFLLFCRTTLYLPSIVRLIALGAFIECHLCHSQRCNPILVTWVICSREGPPLLHHPALQGFSSDLLVHIVLRTDDGIDAGMAHDPLTQRTSYTFKSEAASTSLPFPDHCLGTMLMQDVAASQADGWCAIERLRPADRAPLVAVR